MGLDMYLKGEKFFWNDDRKEDGITVRTLRVELGYWRKHPNLHGYIVKQFADGVDECQEIELSSENIRNIIAAIEEKRLPHTEGFFFGQSGGDEANRDIEIFEHALEWLEYNKQEKPELKTPEPLANSGFVISALKVPKKMPSESRYVIYQASW